MVTFAEFRDCNPGEYGMAAQVWQRLSGRLNDRAKEVDGHVAALSDWHGTAGDAARDELKAQAAKLHESSSATAKIWPVLDDVHQRLDTLHYQLQQALNAARDNNLSVNNDGTVVAGGTVMPPPGRVPQPPPASGAPAPRSNTVDPTVMADRLSIQIQDVVRQASEADATAGATLRGLTATACGLADGPGDPSTRAATAIPIPDNKSPAEVKRWWGGLSALDRESLIFGRPEIVGNMDGIPVEARDRANRSLLVEQKEQLTEQLGTTDPARLEEIKGKLAGIEAIENRLNLPVDQTHAQAYLMKVSTDGSGRAVVAMGNPDTAANVATYVPGTGSGLAKCGGDLDRSDRMAAAARNAGSPSTSVITWVGYDAPQSIPEAASEDFALGAENDLRRFQDGLRASHEGAPSHNTVIGHSYGTTTVGYAARDGSLNADDVTFVASPGVGTYDVRGLHLTGVDPSQMSQHVHSTVAEHDIIHLADDSFGFSPTDPGFGGQVFTSDPGTEGPWYQFGLSGEAHSQYWDVHNKALVNMGHIIAGKPTI